MLIIRFGKSPRDPKLNNLDTPGPGSYNIKPKIFDVPKYIVNH